MLQWVSLRLWETSMLRAMRIGVLLYVLAFVAVGTVIDSKEATDWDYSLRVVVYPIAGDESDSVQRHIGGLTEREFTAIESFLAREAERYALPLRDPLEIYLATERGVEIPELGRDPSWISIAFWSLRMRWTSMLLSWNSDLPAPNITLFAVYHDPDSNVVLDRSTALRKGLIAIANLYADANQVGGNEIVMTHELLHTLGATDKYSLDTLLPDFPDGYGEPDLKPLHPQRFAEIMAGRIALSAGGSRMPDSLGQVRVGQLTATEIGWATAP
jgi:hypothetical protein